ncbi:GAF domain-containing protein [Massilia sp. CCM 9210]|uniref:GAF domain-containing protein n=1 Tax=Massilia scottii TaxID=3057166 RepID=UPI0027968296|nr:GAF domain-containing protein [Massilia sp. CCM 9210]MDQ1817483.1 GAF domain-containing protein [Massilia sp. CCM 9210]
MTTSDAARLLGVATSTVQLWMESGAIASWKTPGGHRRALMSSVLRMTRSGRPAAASGSAPLAPEFTLPAAPPYPVPDQEQLRLSALAALQLVPSPAEERFDRIVRLAALVADCPIALITLLTAQRQWFKARVGLKAADTPREWAFCTHAILQREPFIVEDALQDARFRDNPLVTGTPEIRFYAAFPLMSVNHLALGTLCVIDREPRRLKSRELQGLEDLASMATRELNTPPH